MDTGETVSKTGGSFGGARAAAGVIAEMPAYRGGWRDGRSEVTLCGDQPEAGRGGQYDDSNQVAGLHDALSGKRGLHDTEHGRTPRQTRQDIEDRAVSFAPIFARIRLP